MNHDEYTDYSCSTTIERLSRDVETLMRSWHLVGSDRHVSFSHSFERSSMTSARSDSMPNLFAGIEVEEEESQRDLSMSSSGLLDYATSQQANDSTMREKRHAETRLIRSSDVTFVLSRGGERLSVPLTLALWDSPSNRDESSSLLQETSHLPHSLRRTPFVDMPFNTFDNFSTLFGIGQHITMTPSDPGITLEITKALHYDVSKRHAASTSPSVTVGSLSAMLQTALNCAASNCACRIPVFGLWGSYQPNVQNLQSNTLFPKWISQSLVPTETRRKKLFRKKSKSRQHAHLNRRVCVAPLSANLVSADPSPGATFWASRIAWQEPNLTEWANILVQQCDEATVALWGARHVYTWTKVQKRERTSILFDNSDDETYREWRKLATIELDATSTESAETYRRQCRRHAVSLLQQAVGATPEEPMWGSADDPLKNVTVTVTWNGQHTITWNGKKTLDSVEPLMVLPLKIRSRKQMSRNDLRDAEEAMERATLDPFQLSADFVIQARYDLETELTPLAASQRCVLAALIRTASLHPDTLLQHVTNEAVLDEWSEGGFDVAALDWIMNQSRVGQVTRSLVEAMNWVDVADHMIEYEEAQHIVYSVLDQTSTLTYPSPPEQVFASRQKDGISKLFAPLLKSAPFGRLVSILFLNMSRLRSPSSMSLVWTAFVTELRNRWYSRASLPNMGFVPGLDPHPDDARLHQGFSTLGVKAEHAAFVHCSEPDPDDFHCLIGQRLQVFNICIECMTASDLLEMEKLEKKNAEQQNRSFRDEEESQDGSDHACHAPSVASTEVMNNTTPLTNATLMSDATSAHADDGGESKRNDGDIKGLDVDGRRGPIVDTFPPKGFMGAIEEGHEHSTAASGSTKQEYCDATQGPSISDSMNCDVGLDVVDSGRDDTANVTQRQNRKGARCPVHGVTLIASGDQLYAPYLQRPNPLTDKTIMERRIMLAQRRHSGGPTKRSADGTRRVQDRLELAHRLQKPKLLSDMRAFKAANPGAVFQDFINWYGNPGNPLDEYKDDPDDDVDYMGAPTNMSAAVKLDRASEAIQILNSTRDFWSDTWDEASPCAAKEQKPLFDVYKTVEMVLHHLETLHPASLMNQIMAVNLSMSYFVLLASGEDALQVGVVQTALQRLREKTESVLDMLARDVTDGAYSTINDQPDFGRMPKHASSEAIAACEHVCNVMADVEALVARATTLLHKFPKQYELVQTILRRAEGDSISLDVEEGRRGILNVIKNQQHHLSSGSMEHHDDVPVPCLREYILRNRDGENPCQMCVRFGDERVGAGAEGGMILALTKCYRD